MPAMPRFSGKTRRIAFSILGTPANFGKQRKTKLRKKLVADETRLMK